MINSLQNGIRVVLTFSFFHPIPCIFSSDGGEHVGEEERTKEKRVLPSRVALFFILVYTLLYLHFLIIVEVARDLFINHYKTSFPPHTLIFYCVYPCLITS
ncbi:hypothetical protein ACJX0J_031479, partial [Zea mays]